MSESDKIYSIETLIGMTILSRVTANKLGKVLDVMIDPETGLLDGLVIVGNQDEEQILNYREISSFGPDAVMARDDDSPLVPAEGELTRRPCAKRDLIGAKLISEGGRLLGEVSNVHLYLLPPPLAIYEVRDSIIDKLLGRTAYIPASMGLALSGDAERIIVPDDTAERATNSLEELAERHIRPMIAEEETRVRGEETVDSSFASTA
jgi:uncharacterized protein YrrD